jgi:amino acid adenylation domain-containing protein
VGTSNIEDIYELSPLQQGMLLHSAHDGASDMYLSQQTYTALGPLDPEVLVEAWQAASLVHPALRTSFHWQGLDRPLQVVHRDLALPVYRHDWSGLDREQEIKRLEQLQFDDRARGFDLAVPPLQRLNLIRLSDEENCLLWTYHHLLMDGWSVPVFFGEVVAQYKRLTAGEPAPPPAPPFRDYIAWLQRQEPAATKSFWTEYLAGLTPSHLIPLRPWDPRRATGEVERRMVSLSAELSLALRDAAARHHITFGTLTEAAWAIMLCAYAGRDEVTFGSASSGRPVDLPDVERMVGMFANTLPVRITVPEDGEVGGWLRDVQRRSARMRRFDYTPLADIKRWAGAPGRDMFESLVVVENYWLSLEAGEQDRRITFRREGLYDKINFPLTMTIAPGPTVRLQLLVHRERFEPGFIDDVHARLCATFEALATSERIATLRRAAGPVPELPDVEERRPNTSAALGAAVAAIAPAEQEIAEVFREILGLADVDVTASFFELGGDSFDAVRAIGRLEGASLGMLAANPSVRELAAALESEPTGESALDDEIADLELQLAGKRAERAQRGARHRLVPVLRDGPVVCAFGQEALWFMNQLDPASTTYHVPFPLRIRGRFDVAAMGRALVALVTRHEALRTRFVNHGGLPRQVIDPPPPTMPMPVVDLAPDRLDEWAAAECYRPFDLASSPGFRVALARLGRKDHALVIVAHHIVADGWSSRIMAGELFRLYSAEVTRRPLELPALPVQPADFAAWQRGWLEGEERERHVGFWRDTLAGLSTIDFPADRGRPARPTFRGTTISRPVPAPVAAAARAYAGTQGASLLAVLQAGLLTVLQRYTGQSDLPIGSLFSGRTSPDIEPLVGFFGNTIVLRTIVEAGSSFADLVQRCRRTVLEATAHQDVPFPLVVDALRPDRIAGRTPLFQVGLTLLPRGISEGIPLQRFAIRPINVPEPYAAFDISVDLGESPDGGLDLSVEYATDLFDADRMDRFMDHFVTALAHGLRAPDTAVRDIDVIPPAEQRRTTHDFATGARPRGVRRWLHALTVRGRAAARPVHLLVERAAARTPDAVAVIAPEVTQLTYAQLDRAANQLAHRLRREGVRPGALVGICLPGGADLVTAILATWKAGAAYVGLDPDLPAERFAALHADARPELVVTVVDRAARFNRALALDADPAALAAESTRALSRRTNVTNVDGVACVLATADSTGPGRAVLLSHRAVGDEIARWQDMSPLHTGDRVLHRTSYAFGASLREIIWPLVAGATVVAPGADPDGADLHPTVARHGITAVHVTPTVLVALLEGVASHGPLRSLRHVFTSGEPLRPDLARRFRTACPDAALINAYGTAETLAVTAWPAEAGATSVLIGRPLAGVRVLVLDERLRPAPIGIPGQLYVGGPGLAHAYARQPGLTAQRFLPDPYADRAGQRMFATGDLACWDSNGGLRLLGPVDHPVRLSGHRIDPLEIESALAEQPGVRRCAVRPGTTGHLVAYVVGDELDLPELRRRLAGRVAAFMIPATFVSVPVLPLTPDGRLDPTRLPEPDSAPPHIPPRTATESGLAATWQDLLDVPYVGSADNFFDLGGNSLHSTQLVARIADLFGIHLGPLDVFTNPTVELLAGRVDELLSSQASEGIRT